MVTDVHSIPTTFVHVNLSAEDVADTFIPVVTVTSTLVVAVPLGDVAVILVAPLNVTAVAAVPPKLTTDEELKFAPVMVT